MWNPNLHVLSVCLGSFLLGTSPTEHLPWTNAYKIQHIRSRHWWWMAWIHRMREWWHECRLRHPFDSSMIAPKWWSFKPLWGCFGNIGLRWRMFNESISTLHLWIVAVFTAASFNASGFFTLGLTHHFHDDHVNHTLTAKLQCTFYAAISSIYAGFTWSDNVQHAYLGTLSVII